MASLFMGKTGLRTQYIEVLPANLSSAVDKATAFLFATITHETRICLLANGTSADLTILVKHKDADNDDPAFRHKLIEIPAGTPFNLDTSFGMNLSLDEGTRVYAYVSNGAVSPNEKLRAFFWG